MRATRPALALALAASFVSAGVAGAAVKKPAPKPVCNLVTDAAGDANGFLVTGLPAVPSDKNLDILSADIASDAKNVTAVIRLAAVGADQTSPTGGTVYFNFSIGDTKVFLSAVLNGATATYEAGDFTGTNGQRHHVAGATGFIDTASKSIHITTAANTWTDIIKAGTKLNTLNVLAQRYIGNALVGGVTPTADDATSDKVYTGGAKSCVTPGT
jgi:hypothetical protein